MKRRYIAFVLFLSAIIVGGSLIFPNKADASCSGDQVNVYNGAEYFCVNVTVPNDSTTKGDGFRVSYVITPKTPADVALLDADTQKNYLTKKTPDAYKALGSWYPIKHDGITQTTGYLLNGGVSVEVSDTNSFTNLVGSTPIDLTMEITRQYTGSAVNIGGLTRNTPYYVRIVFVDFFTGNKIYSQTVTGKTKDDDTKIDTSAQPQLYGGDQNTSDPFIQLLNKNDLSCGYFPGTWFKGCFVQFIYGFPYKISSYILVGAGYVFDAFASFSISSHIYRDSSFVTSGWAIIRDISNLFFIFALLWVAISTILGTGGANTKKTIGTIIIVALLINFSLFFTKIVIDSSNILARIFYNQITIVGKDGNSATNSILNQNTTQIEEKSLSSGIANGFNVQRIISPEVSDKINLDFTTVLLILVMAIIVNLVAAWTFFLCAFLFLGRIIGLWVVMIFSPFAFVSNIVPGISKGMKGLGWDDWLKDLLSLSFLAPVFIFFMYLIILFLSTPFLKGLLAQNATTDKGFVETLKLLVGILLQFMIIITLLKRAQKLAESMAGEAGAAMAGIAKTVGGLAIGAATGGAAFIGRKGIGSLAAKAAESSTMKDFAANSRIGKYALAQTRGISNASFDLRNSKVGASIGKGTGADLGKVKSQGYVKDKQKTADAQKKFADSLAPGKLEKEMLNKFENEAKRKKTLMARGEKDPYTGKIPDQDEIDRADKAVLDEKARLKSVGGSRREKFAQQVEQGINPLDFAVNKISKAVGKDMKKLGDDLVEQEDHLKDLQTRGIGGSHPKTGKPITQADMDNAQKNISQTKHKMRENETGNVTYHNENTANEIRDKVSAAPEKVEDQNKLILKYLKKMSGSEE